MIRRNYRPENDTRYRKYKLYKLPAYQSAQTSALQNASYAVRSHHHYSDAIFRATLGFFLDTGVLPMKPIQTASAARPLLPQRRARQKIGQSEIQDTATLQTALKRPANITPPFSSSLAQEPRLQPAVAGADSSTGHWPAPVARRRRVKRHFLSLQSGLFAGMISAIIAMTIGLVWWLEAGEVRLATSTTPSSIQPQSPHPEIAQPRPNAQAGHNTYGGIAGAGTLSSHPKDETPSGNAQPEQSPVQPPEARQSPIAETPIAPAVEARPDAADTSVVKVQKKQANAEEKRRAPQRSATANGKQRAKEINRLRVEAFSEMKKDRVGTVRSVPKTPAPESRFEQNAAKRASMSQSPLAKQVGLAKEFDQCKRIESFFQREKCKWQICAGQWGTNGCPTYNHDIARY